MFRTLAALAVVLSVPAEGPRAPAPQSPVDEWVVAGKQAMYRLDYPEARAAFQRIVATEPDSPVGYGMLSVLAWNELLLASSNVVLNEYGTPSPYEAGEIFKPIEDESRRFHEANDRLLAACQRILAGDPGNAEALYFEGLAYENLAAEALTINQSKWDAVGPGRRAQGIHKEVLELDSRFVDANVSVATYQFALATIPALAKMFLAPLRLFGFLRGDKEGAFELLEEVGRSGRYRDLDALVVLSVMHAFEGDPHRAVAILQDLGRRFPANFMIDLNLAAIQELNVKSPSAALATYRTLLDTLPAKAPGLAEGEVRFRIGRTEFRAGAYDRAEMAFERAVTATHHEDETLPLSYYHLAMIRERASTPARALEAYRRVISLGGAMPSLQQEVSVAERKVREAPSNANTRDGI